MASVTIPLSSSQLEQILQLLSNPASTNHPVAPMSLEALDEVSKRVSNVTFDRNMPQQFRQLLRGKTEKLVRFIVDRGHEFFNDELAANLGFDNPAYTSSVLGKITGKLRRIGVRAEGHRHMNWYTTHKEDGRTLLRVRPDVLQLFKEAYQ